MLLIVAAYLFGFVFSLSMYIFLFCTLLRINSQELCSSGTQKGSSLGYTVTTLVDSCANPLQEIILKFFSLKLKERLALRGRRSPVLPLRPSLLEIWIEQIWSFQEMCTGRSDEPEEPKTGVNTSVTIGLMPGRRKSVKDTKRVVFGQDIMV